MTNLKTAIDLDAGVVLVVIKDVPQPSQCWLDMQETAPVEGEKFFTAYPLSGGAMSVQLSKLQYMTDAKDSVFDDFNNQTRFNPALEAINALRSE